MRLTTPIVLSDYFIENKKLMGCRRKCINIEDIYDEALDTAIDVALDEIAHLFPDCSCKTSLDDTIVMHHSTLPTKLYSFRIVALKDETNNEIEITVHLL